MMMSIYQRVSYRGIHLTVTTKTIPGSNVLGPQPFTQINMTLKEYITWNMGIQRKIKEHVRHFNHKKSNGSGLCISSLLYEMGPISVSTCNK